MLIRICFYSYFKDLAGCAETAESLAAGSTLGDLLDALVARFPKLAAARQSMLLAVGVEYQNRQYVLQDQDDVSLFPPVQGG